MGWKMTGRPTVRQQRGKWVVRVDGVDTASGKPRPRQIGTYPSRHAAAVAASAAAARGAGRTGKGTVGWAVERWVHSRSDVGESTRAQYEWAAGHIAAGIGGLKLEDLDREDVVRWLDELAADGRFGRRSIQIFRTVLRAALADAVDRGDLQRSPASRVGMPRAVAKAPSQKAVRAWDQEQTGRFLREATKHRWGPALRLAVLYGLRRRELLGLRWSDIDFDASTLTIGRGLVEVDGKATWTEGKNARSRRTIPLGPSMLAALAEYRRDQAEERLDAGDRWEENDASVATRLGRVVSPANFSSTLATIVKRAAVPPLPSHGLRHTAAPVIPRPVAHCRPCHPTACGTLPPRSWSGTPTTWARCGPQPTSSATAPTC